MASPADGAVLLLLLLLLVTPMLTLGCNAYFLARLRGQELGFKGLFSRTSSWGKAVWLNLQIYARVFLWSLLLIVPGFIAAFRYMLAPYYLAENPELSARECIEKSKQTMEGAKLSLFALLLSFIGWQLLSSLLQIYLLDLNPVVSIVVGLSISLFVATYTNAAVAAFFLALTDERLKNRQSMTPEQLMRALSQMSGLPSMPFAGSSEESEETPPDDADDRRRPGDEGPGGTILVGRRFVQI